MWEENLKESHLTSSKHYQLQCPNLIYHSNDSLDGQFRLYFFVLENLFDRMMFYLDGIKLSKGLDRMQTFSNQICSI